MDQLRQPQNLVSYHLGLLKRAGLLTERRSSADARDVYYHLNLDRLRVELSSSAAAIHPALGLIESPRPLRGKPSRRPRVLFVCSGNSARSQMAEAILRKLVGTGADVRSAGPHPSSVHPLALKVLSELGLPTRGLRSKDLEQFAGDDFDYVISLCDIAREECPPRWERARWIHWSLPDPAAVRGGEAKRADAFRRTAAELELRIQQLVPLLALGKDQVGSGGIGT